MLGNPIKVVGRLDLNRIIKRVDGTFEIMLNGMPYHVIPSDPLFAEVSACAAARPEAVVLEQPPSPPTLEDVKMMKRAEIIAARDGLIAAGFDWDGHHYPLSLELSNDMLIKLMAMQMLPPPTGYVYQWKDNTGVYQDIGNAEGFKTFCAAALVYGETLFARERMLQELVEVAETVEAVQAITWETAPEEG